jgi:two-component system cell cycle response regulator DivK
MRRCSVLIVDDVEDTRDMYAEYLTFKGYFVDTAVNGRDGMTKAFDTKPDVIVLDLTMPGIDGFEAMRLLRADRRTAKTFVVVVSGHALKGTRDAVMMAGADVFLTKPCLPDDLERTIVGRRQPGRRRN